MIERMTVILGKWYAKTIQDKFKGDFHHKISNKHKIEKVSFNIIKYHNYDKG